MVYMGNWEDRDQMMQELTISRPVGCCLCSDTPLSYDHISLDVECSLCGADELTVVCPQSCQFALCDNCMENDVGRQPAEDPHEALVGIAKNIADCLLHEAAWENSSGAVSGDASLLLHWMPAWGDVKPPAFSSIAFPERSSTSRFFSSLRCRKSSSKILSMDRLSPFNCVSLETCLN